MRSATQTAVELYPVRVNKSIIGARVTNAQSEDLGKIEDLVIDGATDSIAYAILSFGGVLGLGDKQFAIPWEALIFDLPKKIATLNIEKDLLKNAPGFDKDEWPSLSDKAWITGVYAYYGFKPYWNAGA